MPIQFVGQWCNDNREGSDSTWQLPSWHKGQPCEEILSIDEFYFSDGGLSCEPVRVRLFERYIGNLWLKNTSVND